MSRTALILFLILVSVSPVLSQPDKHDGSPDYQPEVTYAGPYKADRLYQFNRYEETWYAVNRLKYWKTLPCLDARRTLESKGEWIGGLTDTGACSGYEEAPLWGSGNYLNFLVSERINNRTR